MIAPMTGGVARGHELNRMLFRAAEKWRLPVGVGSQRVALENAKRASYFTYERMRRIPWSLQMLVRASFVRGGRRRSQACCRDDSS